jgi:hypothetical protein
MKWIIVNSHCYRIKRIEEFYWQNGVLAIQLLDRPSPDLIYDPEQDLYIRLCNDLGLEWWKDE